MNRQSRSGVVAEDSLREGVGEEYLVYALVAEQVERCLNEGREIDVSGVIDDHPKLESQIRELVPSLAALCQVGPLKDEAHTRQVGGFRNHRRTMLGDFALGREIGRGGMGVVYEAMQVSLGRRVALKVLPFAAVLDKRQLQRFKNEAQAAAALHHPNIVPVFAVGCERGVHYYAMQYIEGRDLAAAISQLRHLCDAVADSHSPSLPKNPGTMPAPAAAAETRPYDSQTAGNFGRGPEYYRTIAEMGAQAAEALEYAHQRGIVHRDIKPSNLMIDDEGKIWIADFGLAQIESDASLTGTGDMVGTLRYMSPEQISGRPTDVDHRSDIFALGATLYELATLQPLYSAETRSELMRERTGHEPASPRKLDPTIPLDLETIILKAISKEAGARYRTAEKLAEDLKRFLNGQPIAARRPDMRVRITNWSKRNRHLIWSAGILVCGGLFFLAGLALAPQRRQDDKERTNPQTAQTERETPAAGQTEVEEQVQATLAPGGESDVNGGPEVSPDVAPETSVQASPPDASAAANAVPEAKLKPNVDEPRQDARVASISPGGEPTAQPAAQDEPPFTVPEPPPPPLPKFESETARETYVGLIEQLLVQGLSRTGKNSVEAAKKHARDARRLCREDPRLDYALGLVLLKNFRSQEAMAQFQAADERGNYPYFPARQAEIWYLLSRKDYEHGVGRLADLAKTIADSPAHWPDAATRTSTAHWIGRVAGYLNGPGSSRKAAAALQQPGRDFRNLLSEPFRLAYDAGLLLTSANHAQLKSAAEDIRKASQLTQDEKRRSKQDDVAGRLKSVEGKQKELGLTLQQWKDWLQDQKDQADETLGELEKQFIELEEQAKSLQRSMQALNFEINLLTQIVNGNNSGSGPISRTDARQDLLRKNDQMIRYQAQYNATDRQAALVNGRARKIVAERQDAVRRYEKETGQFVQQEAKIRKWTKRLKRREQRLNNKPIGRSAQFSAALRNMKSLRSYVDIDWQAEQQRILNSYALGKAEDDASAEVETD